ncbi:hypothetical protein [Actinacidiphila guanduensis]|nr:hypothetical protein [Actinacidiphila guanduensis]
MAGEYEQAVRLVDPNSADGGGDGSGSDSSGMPSRDAVTGSSWLDPDSRYYAGVWHGVNIFRDLYWSTSYVSGFDKMHHHTWWYVIGANFSADFRDETKPWTEFRDIPAKIFPNLMGGSFENDVFSPNSLKYAADMVDGIRTMLADWIQAFTGWANAIDVADSDFQGTAAGIFQSKIIAMCHDMQGIRDQLTEKDTSGQLNATGEDMKSAAQNLGQAWFNWCNDATISDPRIILFDSFMNAVNSGVTRIWKGKNYINNRNDQHIITKMTKYGDPSTTEFWDSLEADAKKQWIDNLAPLDDAAKAFLSKLDTSYTSASMELPTEFHDPPEKTSSSDLGQQTPDGPGQGPVQVPDHVDLPDPGNEGDPSENIPETRNIPDIGSLGYPTDSSDPGFPSVPGSYAFNAPGDTPGGNGSDDGQGGFVPGSESGPLQPGSLFTGDGGGLAPSDFGGSEGAMVLGPDGKPVLGPDGEPVDVPAGSVIRPDGSVVGPDGKPVLGPDGKPLKFPPGSKITSDGLDPSSAPGAMVLGPDGKPVLGPDGEPVDVPAGSVIRPDGSVVGPDGKPVLGPDGKPLKFPPGSKITSDSSLYVPESDAVVGPNGMPIVGPDGLQVTVPAGSTVRPDGSVVGPDGKPVLGPNGEPLKVPVGSSLVQPGAEQLFPGDSSNDSDGYLDTGGDIRMPKPLAVGGSGAFDPGSSVVVSHGGESLKPADLGRLLRSGGTVVSGGTNGMDPDRLRQLTRGFGTSDEYKPLLDPEGVLDDAHPAVLDEPGAENSALPLEEAAQEESMLGRVATVGGAGTESEPPMIPPMTGGMGGTGGGAGARKTWVTEDEETWGTSTATPGVIGR